ncbi:hypothetical protein ABZU86_32545 [Streptomyces sp. NPDC005271]|uniref:hypothetical protein n=1 Tax=unclassified Streptomyces TaxID=2593676 RepID=UPI0033A55078
MRTHSTAAAAVVATTTLLLTGCSAVGGSNDKRVPPGAPASAVEAGLSKAEITQRCVDAIVERAAATRGGAVRSSPVPKPCTPLSDDEYLDAYMDGLHEAQKDAREKLDDRTEEPAGATAG